MTTDRLAALLHKEFITHEMGKGKADDICGLCTERAARLAAAGVTVAPQPAHPGHCITCDGHLDDPYHGPEPCLLCPHAFPHHEFKPVPVTGDAGLREALEAILTQPTTDFHTTAARALFDKAMRSATQEVTITAQALRLVLPAIEGEAITLALRAALATGDEP